MSSVKGEAPTIQQFKLQVLHASVKGKLFPTACVNDMFIDFLSLAILLMSQSVFLRAVCFVLCNGLLLELPEVTVRNEMCRVCRTDMREQEMKVGVVDNSLFSLYSVVTVCYDVDMVHCHHCLITLYICINVYKHICVYVYVCVFI